jgi:ribosomal-protein-alanine N-acetyltransferase
LSPRWAIESATPDDVPALAELEALCFSHPWTAVQLAEEVAQGPPGEVLLARGREAEGRVRVGAYCAYRVVADEMHVMNVAVLPGWRRQGLGGFLVRLALRRAARAGARAAFLEVRAGNAAAIALYGSLGFRRMSVRRDYYREPSENALVLGLFGLSARP